MDLRNKPTPAFFFCALCFGAASLARAAPMDDGCAGFKWDVSQERALFGSTAQDVAAGGDGASAPALIPNRLYRLRLLPRGAVSFAVPPGRSSPTAAGYAGLAALQVPASGSYRISIDLPLWVDVAAKGALVPPRDYEAEQSCEAPRKIVVFDLDAGRGLMLQFSAADRALIRLTVTRVLVK